MIVRSIDLGYGNVKYSVRNRNGEGPEIVTRHFPALALPVTSNLQMAGLGLKSPQTVEVNVKEALYQVGPDTPLLLAGRSGRELNENYSRSDRYDALMKGTLAYMGERSIDLLVLGLPVSKYEQERERIRSLYTGVIEVPMIGERDRKVKVEIKKVVVLPQPVGGFIDARANNTVEDKWRGVSLVIDPGFYTFDWVVVSENSTFVGQRSGARHGGVSSIIQAVTQCIEHEIGRTVDDANEIDQALKTGEPAHIYGKPVSLEKYAPQTEAACKAFVDEMVARLGATSDLRRIVLCGGGARLFKAAIQAAFPGMPLHVTRDSMFANVRGFQSFGLGFAKTLAQAA